MGELTIDMPGEPLVLLSELPEEKRNALMPGSQGQGSSSKDRIEKVSLGEGSAAGNLEKVSEIRFSFPGIQLHVKL